MKIRLLQIRAAFIALLFFSQIYPFVTHAQDNLSTVRAVVHGENNQPLAGVSVSIRNSQTGFSTATKTDTSGVFIARVPVGGPYTFTITSIGYETQTLSGYTLKEGVVASLDIEMKTLTNSMEQVVVVGYGTQRRANVTTAISSVNSTTIARAATSSAAGALQGNVPGAVVVKNPGKPGSGYNITIRGTSSIGGSSYPLIVVDGIPANINIGDLNPADIEKIDILKDASATAIYGSRGSKGVVIITTKRGKAGKTIISYDAYMGQKKATNLPEMMNGTEYVAFRTEMFQAQGKSTDRNNAAFFTPQQWANIDAGRFTDWPSLIIKDALQMNHNITASGGDQNTRFSLAAGLLKEEGNVAPESFKRYTLRGSIDRQINKSWKAGMSFYLAQNLQDEGSSEALRSSYRLPPMAYPYDSTGARVFRVYGTDAVTHPEFDQENEIRQNRNFKTFGNLFIQVEPIRNLILKSSISPSYSSGRSGFYFGPLSKQSLGGALATQAQNSSNEQLTWVLDNQAIYDTRFGEHQLSATVVQSVQQDRIESNSIQVDQLPYRSLWYNVATGGRVLAYSSGFTKSTLVSAMGRVNYSYKDKYLVTATGRWDGSSKLAEGNKWGFFPSASIAWRISKEGFMENVAAINDLKLRLSYGESGNDRVGAYSTQATLGSNLL